MIVTALIRLAEPQFSSAATAGEKVPPQREKLVGTRSRSERGPDPGGFAGVLSLSLRLSPPCALGGNAHPMLRIPFYVAFS